MGRSGQYTVEGEIEQIGAFARGLKDARGRRRAPARVVLVMLILLALSGPITFLFSILR